MNMKEFISEIHIDNFKSIRAGRIENCRRINLIIGRPNVGKSNLLEALSLFSLPFLRKNRSRSITDFIRIENETEIFYKGNYERPCSVTTNIGSVQLDYLREEGIKVTYDSDAGNATFFIDTKLNLRFAGAPDFRPDIRKFSFRHDVKFKKGNNHSLTPPHGYNLFSVIEFNEELKRDVYRMFAEYNLQLVFDKASQSLKIVQQLENDLFLIPYSSVADTLQRIIFFKTAIVSNKNSVLVFEEPEAHSFPPYISQITQEMIYQKTNQYFIATHSPFILNEFLENSREELSVYLIDYKDDQTFIKLLSPDELNEIYQNGVDLFTNSETYL